MRPYSMHFKGNDAEKRRKMMMQERSNNSQRQSLWSVKGNGICRQRSGDWP